MEDCNYCEKGRVRFYSQLSGVYYQCMYCGKVTYPEKNTDKKEENVVVNKD